MLQRGGCEKEEGGKGPASQAWTRLLILTVCMRVHVCCLHAAGDVLLHTVTDAILGALSLPDIGAVLGMRGTGCD